MEHDLCSFISNVCYECIHNEVCYNKRIFDKMNNLDTNLDGIEIKVKCENYKEED